MEMFEGWMNCLSSGTSMFQLIRSYSVWTSGGSPTAQGAESPGDTLVFSAQRVCRQALTLRRVIIGVASACVLMIGRQAAAACPVAFLPESRYPAGGTPTAIIARDFNGDSHVDLAISLFADNRVAVLLGDGHGSFGPAVTSPTGSGPVAIAAGDFDRNGALDLISADTTSYAWDVLLGQRDGRFQLHPPPLAQALGVLRIAIADLDADGNADAVTLNGDTRLIQVFKGHGDATFEQLGADYFAFGRPSDLLLDDMNADGKIDIVVTCDPTAEDPEQRDCRILLNNGNGSFAPFDDSPSPLIIGNGPGGAAAADFNADGRMDFAVNLVHESRVAILLQGASGQYSLASSYPVTWRPNGIAAADLNLDGKPDVVTAAFDSNRVSVLIGNESGGFSGPYDFPVGTGPISVAVADFNEDGISDVATVNRSSGDVSVLINADAASVRVIYVDQQANGSNNGRGWANAFTDLQDALLYASTVPCVEEIWVARGTYKPAGFNGDRTASFQLRSNLAIYGGFAGTEAALSQRNISANPTILSGDLNSDDNGDLNASDNSKQLVNASEADSTAALDGFVLTSAKDTSTSPAAVGGALVCNNSRASLRNLRILNCASTYGGGAYVSGVSHVLFDTCEFTGNRAFARGGACEANGAGAIAQFKHCRFAENLASMSGSAPLNGLGGAISCFGPAAAYVSWTDFVQNSAGDGGAISLEGGGSATVMNARFLANRAVAINGAGGGARSIGTGSLYLYNCLMQANTAPAGSAVLELTGPSGLSKTVLVNCTLVGNQAQQASAAVVTGPNGPGAKVEVTNSIVWANTAGANSGESAQIQVAGGDVLLERSIIQGWTGALGGSGMNGADPLFVSPSGPGDDGLWGTSDDATLQVHAGSPAIDSGDTLSVPQDIFDLDDNGNTSEALPLDLLGVPRVLDDPGTPDTGFGGFPSVDRGCYEGYRCAHCPDDRQWFRAQTGEWSDDLNWSFSFPTPCVYSTLAVAGAPYTITFRDADAARGLIQSRGDVALAGELTASTLTLAPPVSSGACPSSPPDPSLPSLRVQGTPSDSPRLTVLSGVVKGLVGDVARSPGTRGELNVSGPGSRLTFPTGSLAVGQAGVGTLGVTGGGTCYARSLSVGELPADTAGSDGLFDQHGFVRVNGVGSKLIVPTAFQVAWGRVDVESGALIDLTSTGTLYLDPGSTLAGDGTVLGNIINFGTVDAGNRSGSGLGTLTVNGSYNQVAVDPSSKSLNIGSLRVRIGSASGQGGGATPASDRLVVNGPATLGGSLVFSNTSTGYVPNLNDSFNCLSATSRTGTFTVSQMPGLPGLKYFLPTYTGGTERSGGVNVVVASLNGDITLNPAPSQPVSGLPRGAVIADFDNDGDLDLAISVPDPTNPSATPGSVVILRNAGNTGPGGTWAGFTQGQKSITVGRDPRGLAFGRFDAGSSNDLAVCNFADGTVQVLRAFTAADTLPPTAQTINVGAGPIAIAAGDIRGGGLIDLAVANQLSNSISVINNNGSGGFAVSATLNTDSAPTDIILANLDAQPGLDIAAANRDSNNITVYYRQPGGTYHNAPDRRLLAGNEPGSIEPGQIDNGKDQSPTQPQDLVCANRASGTLSFFLNDGNGGFTPGAELPAGTNPESVTMGDLDDDVPNHDPDLAVVTTNSNGQRVVRVFRNDLTGTTLTYTVFGDQFVGDGPQLVRAADVAANGRADLIAVTALSSAARPDGTSSGERTANPVAAAILCGPLPPPCPTDLTGDRVTNTADLVQFLLRFGQSPAPGSPGAAADINRDGTVNTSDLTLLLVKFGQACP